MQSIVQEYDPNNITIGVLCSHSAIETAYCAQTLGLPVIGITTKGRDITYAQQFRNLFDELIYVDKFEQDETVISEDVIDYLIKNNTIFIPNRSLDVYLGFDSLENEFCVPLFGGRNLQRAEERVVKGRTTEKSQYEILKEAGAPTPQRFTRPEDINKLAIIKTQDAKNPLERAFFYASTPEEYYLESEKSITEGLITREGLEKAVIEEFLVGPYVNADFHCWSLNEHLPEEFTTGMDLGGFSKRRQSNRSGLMEMPAKEQLKIDGKIKITNEEVSHEGCTIRESLHGDFYNIAYHVKEAINKLYPEEAKGMIGLQGVLVKDPITRKLVFKTYDLALRVPGDPPIGPTSPLMGPLTHKYYSSLQRAMQYPTEKRGYLRYEIDDPVKMTMLEIIRAAQEGLLDVLVT